MGTGSVFTLIIPAGVIVSDQPKLNDEHYHVNSEPTKPKRTPKYSGRVLIAEDAPANQKLIMILLKKAGIEAVMTENEIVFGVPVRPGDRLRTQQVLRSVSDPKTTKLGTGRFWVIEVQYLNQHDEIVGTESYTGFGYGRKA